MRPTSVSSPSCFPDFFFLLLIQTIFFCIHFTWIFSISLTIHQGNLSSCSCGFFLVFPALCCWFCLLITALRIERNTRIWRISCQNCSSLAMRISKDFQNYPPCRQCCVVLWRKSLFRVHLIGDTMVFEAVWLVRFQYHNHTVMRSLKSDLDCGFSASLSVRDFRLCACSLELSSRSRGRSRTRHWC